MAARPDSPYNWLKQGELERARGEESASAEAAARAGTLVRASGLAAAA
jgi:hypothetical protein